MNSEMLSQLVGFWTRYVSHMAWQAAVVGLLAVLVIRYANRLSPQVRYAILIVALAKFVIPPFWNAPTGAFGLMSVQSDAPRGNGRGSLRLQSCDWQSLVDAGIARRNSDGFQLNRIGDTDILLCDALRSGNIGAKSVFEQLSLEKSNYMATKSAAFWSLKSNSQFDDIVRECCTLAASKPGGDSRKLLFDQSRDNES